MLKKYSVLIGIIIGTVLLVIATNVYPGGSYFDKNSAGFSWSKNFISNLFGAKALNGADNPSRIWADAGMIFLSASFALFFIHFSKKISLKGPANVIKYLGAGGMLFGFLIVTPLHDLMIIISSTLFLLSIFYITVFIFKTQLSLFKWLCVISLLVFYSTLFLFGARDYREFLPVMQKVSFAFEIILVIALEYFTKKEDFQHIKAGKQKDSEKAVNQLND